MGVHDCNDASQTEPLVGLKLPSATINVLKPVVG